MPNCLLSLTLNGAAVVFCAISQAPARAQVDNFNDGNDAGWYRYDPIHEALEAFVGPPQPAFANWSFPDGGYRLQSFPSPNPVDFGPSRAGSYPTDAAYLYTNFHACVDIRPWGTHTNQAVGLLGRVQTYSQYGAVYAYTLTYEPFARDFQITAFDGGTFSALQAVKVTLAPDRAHRMVFTGVAEKLEGRIYELPNTTDPVGVVAADDLRYDNGFCGLLVFSLQNAATDATYDNYAALPEPPPFLSVTRTSNQVVLSWPVGAVTYSLQASVNLAGTSWTPITAGISQSGGKFIYQTTATGQTFYRLQSP